MAETVLSAGRSSGAVESSAFADFVRPHWEAMQGLAARLADQVNADDVVQDALAVAWRKRAQFDADRGTPRAWLLAITADQARKHRRRLRLIAPLREEAVIVPSIDADLDLHAAILKLSGRQRLAVELYYFIGLPISEVATAMSCSEGTVKSTLSDARAKLRVLVGGE